MSSSKYLAWLCVSWHLDEGGTGIITQPRRPPLLTHNVVPPGAGKHHSRFSLEDRGQIKDTWGHIRNKDSLRKKYYCLFVCVYTLNDFFFRMNRFIQQHFLKFWLHHESWQRGSRKVEAIKGTLVEWTHLYDFIQHNLKLYFENICPSGTRDQSLQYWSLKFFWDLVFCSNEEKD